MTNRAELRRSNGGGVRGGGTAAAAAGGGSRSSGDELIVGWGHNSDGERSDDDDRSEVSDVSMADCDTPPQQQSRWRDGTDERPGEGNGSSELWRRRPSGCVGGGVVVGCVAGGGGVRSILAEALATASEIPTSRAARLLVPSTAANGKRRKAVVRFALGAEVKFHHRVEDMTEEEVKAVWYTDKEYRALKKEVRSTLQYLLLLSKRQAKGTAAPEQIALGKKLCLRGLEHMATPEILAERSDFKDAVVDAVLVEQDRREYARGFENLGGDEEAIARASAGASRWARDIATRAGMKDQDEVTEMRRKERARAARNVAREMRRLSGEGRRRPSPSGDDNGNGGAVGAEEATITAPAARRKLEPDEAALRLSSAPFHPLQQQEQPRNDTDAGRDVSLRRICSEQSQLLHLSADDGGSAVPIRRCDSEGALICSFGRRAEAARQQNAVWTAPWRQQQQQQQQQQQTPWWRMSWRTRQQQQQQQQPRETEPRPQAPPPSSSSARSFDNCERSDDGQQCRRPTSGGSGGRSLLHIQPFDNGHQAMTAAATTPNPEQPRAGNGERGRREGESKSPGGGGAMSAGGIWSRGAGRCSNAAGLFDGARRRRTSGERADDEGRLRFSRLLG